MPEKYTNDVITMLNSLIGNEAIERVNDVGASRTFKISSFAFLYRTRAQGGIECVYGARPSPH